MIFKASHGAKIFVALQTFIELHCVIAHMVLKFVIVSEDSFANCTHKIVYFSRVFVRFRVGKMAISFACKNLNNIIICSTFNMLFGFENVFQI